MARFVAGVALVVLLVLRSLAAGKVSDEFIRLPSDRPSLLDRAFPRTFDGDSDGKKWAVLIAGSSGYWNYRHQADVCHAYQVLKKGGLKDENIIVFMYDDIAYNEENPRPGIIINSPHGDNVYTGVPKDYTGNDVNVNNFLAVILGNKTALTGGSGKVVDSGPNDHIFIFYSDHGGPGVLGMPTYPNLYANDLIETLKKKHAAGAYKSLVFYLEACESGSIFEGLLPKGLNIYATTASNAVENSWGTYCPGDYPSPPPEYQTCLGDLYSVAWMEDRLLIFDHVYSEGHNLKTETLKQQYELVKRRTANADSSNYGSHVMQFGDKDLGRDMLYLYMGTNPANEKYTRVDDNSLRPLSSRAINQRDADLVHFWEKYRKAPEGSTRKVEAQKQFLEAMSHRAHLDDSMKLVGKLLFGIEKGPKVLETVRPAGQPLVDDWKCLKSLVNFRFRLKSSLPQFIPRSGLSSFGSSVQVRAFEEQCGSLSQYGLKHMRSIANICNAGITVKQMSEASAQACPTVPSGPWSSLHGGFSA
ncbi:hypothetical protein Cgig2_011483 [Carnegiea gigantea]|uniref:Legumain prodomain domain-containing protein n=1 Tax=Carnegiea gigantea TaxID=171969 RepID=A0A9Q1KUH2_9CARY|nr:hypothetical protein Cgig2_011483 [Carnegiea gigantea]